MELDPTVTPELNPLFSILFLVLTGAFFIVEMIGVARKERGDTFTENWRAIEASLPRSFAWIFRIGTGGLLIWALLHFLVGAA